MSKIRWRRCPTCGRFTVVNDEGVCGGVPPNRLNPDAETHEGCGQEHPQDGGYGDSKLQIRGGPTPKFFPR